MVQTFALGVVKATERITELEAELAAALAEAERERDEWKQQRDNWQATAERIAKASPLREEYDWAINRAEQAERERDEARKMAVMLLDWRNFDEHAELTSEQAPPPMPDGWRATIDSWRKDGAK